MDLPEAEIKLWQYWDINRKCSSFTNSVIPDCKVYPFVPIFLFQCFQAYLELEGKSKNSGLF